MENSAIRGSRGPRVLPAIVAVALLVRLAALLVFHSWIIPADQDHFGFAYEAGRLAKSVATGQGYASPLTNPSGPSGFLAPLYPAALAGIFRIFGVYTPASAIAAYLLSILASCLTCVIVCRLGTVLFDELTGTVAAALFAVYPVSIWYATTTIWDTSILGCAIAALFLWLYRLPPDPSPRQLILTGLWMGALALLNPAPAFFYPAVIVWLWYRWSAAPARKFARAAIVSGMCFAIVLPWMIRNAVVVGEFTPRTAGGLNFWMGNNEDTWKQGDGTYYTPIYPAVSAEEGRRFSEMGEARYDRFSTERALRFIRENPAKFRDLVSQRFRAWWLGYGSRYTANAHTTLNVALLKPVVATLWLPVFALGAIAGWRRAPLGLLMALIAIYPIPYYFIIQSERYRFAIEPVLFPILAFGLLWLIRRVQAVLRPARHAAR